MEINNSVKILQGANILMAEDGLVNRLLATTILRRHGAAVTEAVDGSEAVAAFKQKEYGLILMDIQMPVMDGLTATRCIRQINTVVPVIALTAAVSANETEKALAAGMNDAIGKPFNEQELVQKIANWLGRDIVIAPKQAAAALGTSLFNLENIKDLSDGDSAFMEKLISLFIVQSNMALQDLQAAMLKKDVAKIKSIAHKLKPSIHNMGIHSLGGTLNEIEGTSVENSDPYQLATLTSYVDTTLKKVIGLLQPGIAI